MATVPQVNPLATSDGNALAPAGFRSGWATDAGPAPTPGPVNETAKQQTGPYFEAMADRADYGRFLTEFGFTEADVLAKSRDKSDQIPMPAGFNALQPGPSYRGGQGMFATNDIAAGQVIGPARVGGMRTPLGSGINHSKTPNAMFLPNTEGGLNAMAVRPIAAGEEATIDNRQAAQVNGWNDQQQASPSFVHANPASYYWSALQALQPGGTR